MPPRKPKTGGPESLTVEAVIKAIHMPPEQWKGNCFAVASKVVDAGLVQGVAVYGHYAGRVSHARGAYYAKSGSTQHGWVNLMDGRIFDLTRWVFENKKPYLHLGPRSAEYDEGGNDLNKSHRGPPPRFDPDEEQHEFTSDMLSSAAYNKVEKILRVDITVQEPGFLTETQIRWLANAHFDDLQPHAVEVYSAIESLGGTFPAYIPFDNRKRADRLKKGISV